ncbi:hypothetical protein HV320_06390 [Citrobacter sp. RHBSTW-00903]|uniref:hypothetical protein n=2 Tax=unclassified Citrobacter TaxID=2644389 RepID=UPI0015EA9DAC|nr:hypothetical protein [Citrobacter sp. RHBSTW-00903]QLS33697.1 hypothetical protein HV320_06390 [Citrobacter sp. RHBSTW-00903]
MKTGETARDRQMLEGFKKGCFKMGVVTTTSSKWNALGAYRCRMGHLIKQLITSIASDSIDIENSPEEKENARK